MVFTTRIDIRLSDEDIRMIASLKETWKLSHNVEVLRVALRTCYVEMELTKK